MAVFAGLAPTDSTNYWKNVSSFLLSDDDIFNRPILVNSNPGTQKGSQKKDFGAVSQMDLPVTINVVKFRLRLFQQTILGKSFINSKPQYEKRPLN